MMGTSPERIFEVASSFMAAKHLFVANEIGLFERLGEGPVDLDGLAQRTAVPRRTLRVVTDAMVALGFVEREGHRYRNAAVAAAFLSGASQPDLRPFLRFWNRISYPRWAELEDAVRRAEAVHGTFQFTPEETRIFSEGVEAITAGTARALAEQYDFGGHRKLLDVGGGTGSFLRPVLQRYPSLRCTLYELPSVAAVARDALASQGLSDSIAVVEGDCLENPLPKGHDAILLANVAHLLSPSRNVELLRRLRAASPAGARLLLVDFWTDATHTQPAFAALMAGEFLLVSGEGDVYSEDEVRGWLAETGWHALERKPLAGPSSLVVAEASQSWDSHVPR